MPSEPPPTDCSTIHPTAWLVAPTLALLLGQAAAAGPWTAPRQAAAIALLPLLGAGWRRWRPWALLATLCGLALALGYARHRDLMAPSFADNHLRSVMARAEEPLYLEGVLRHEPEKLVNRSRWQIAAQRVWHPQGAEEITGEMLLSVRSVDRDWRYGDRVRFSIRPTIPRDSGNPGGFNYASYLSRRRIYVTGFLASDQEIELLGREGHGARAVIENLRRDIRRFIGSHLEGDAGGLLTALVVGDMGGIGKEMRAAFTAAGVNHVLSISGLHVAMLGLVVFALIRYGASFSAYLTLRVNLFKAAAFFSFLAVLFYTALAGAMVPTVRSAIMIGVYQLAILLDREEEIFASLALAALLIALVWPGVVADISFQLSFLAVLFIVWGMRRLRDWVPRPARDQLPQERSWVAARLRHASFHLAVPLLATLGTGPLVAHYFGHLSLAGFIANPVVVPLVGFIVVPLGLIIGFLSVIAPEAGLIVIALARQIVTLTSALVQWLADLPFANLRVPAPGPLEIALLYGLLVSLLAFSRKAHRAIALTVGVCLLTADAAYWWMERRQRTELRVTHLNVGQGDAAVVELPGSKVMVIDAGGTAAGDFDTGEAIVAPYLRARKILKVDYLVVTHPRIDHYGGMRAIIEEFSPAEFWSGSVRAHTTRFEQLEEALARSDLRRVTLDLRQPCRLIESVKLCALHAPAENAAEGSVVLRLEYGNLGYLFAGDIEKREEALLLQSPASLRSAVLKVPRHGSISASTAEFITAVQPQLAIVSAAARGPSEAQRADVIERYRKTRAQVLTTYEDGAIIIESDGDTVRYSTFKSGRKGAMAINVAQ